MSFFPKNVDFKNSAIDAEQFNVDEYSQIASYDGGYNFLSPWLIGILSPETLSLYLVNNSIGT